MLREPLISKADKSKDVPCTLKNAEDPATCEWKQASGWFRGWYGFTWVKGHKVYEARQRDMEDGEMGNIQNVPQMFISFWPFTH